ncbi:hypothetical protein [Acinetobacter sp. USHLN143]|uniref:hypothetical protein n=1 Tax=Acinetobacter sp. USHLN143 TaxID=3081679 RepID=UPI003016DD5D
MDLCVVDWEIIKDILIALIGAGIPSFVAWRIFKNWRGQKGAEVIANEAKQNIQDILEIIKVVGLIRKKSFDSERSKNFGDFNRLYESVVRSSLYIDDCVEIKDFRKSIDEFFDCCLNFKRFESLYRHHAQESKFVEHVDGEINVIQIKGVNIINTLIPYSIYQKKFKFRKK